MGKHDLFEVSQYIVVMNEGKILMLQASDLTRISGKWSFPGGHIDYGETVDESLKREVKEEANIDIEIISPIKTDVIKDTYTTIFAAKYVSGEIKLSEEHSDYRWVKIDEMKNMNLISNVLVEYAEKAMFSENKINA